MRLATWMSGKTCQRYLINAQLRAGVGVSSPLRSSTYDATTPRSYVLLSQCKHYKCGAMTGTGTRLEAVAVLLLPWRYLRCGMCGSLGGIVANKDRALA
jgi:hypothetical protein